MNAREAQRIIDKSISNEGQMLLEAMGEVCAQLRDDLQTGDAKALPLVAAAEFRVLKNELEVHLRKNLHERAEVVEAGDELPHYLREVLA